MKILITSDLFLTSTNGVVTSIKNLREELEKKGHDVRILSISNTRKGYTDGNEAFVGSVSLEWVYPGIRMPTSYRNKIIKEIVEWNPDIIHSQCEIFSFFFALNIAKKTGAPIVHTYHTMYEDYTGYVFLFKRLGRWMIRKATKNRLEHADSVIVPSGKVKSKLVDEQGVRGDFRVIPSGISLDKHKIRISDEERQARRRELGVADDEIALLNLGRLGAEKNVDELLRFFKSAREKNDKLKFLIVGGGPAKESLEATAKELGIEEYVNFVGMVKPDEVPKYYQLADVFLSASTSETQGLTYVEAMANRLPLVCREDACLDGVLIHGRNGYIYTNLEEFLDGVENLVDSPEKRAEMGKESAAIAEEFDKTIFGDRVEKLYFEVIEREKAKKENCKCKGKRRKANADENAETAENGENNGENKEKVEK